MKKALSLIIIALMTLTLLTACQKSGNDEVTTTTPSGEVVLDKELEIRVSVLSGTTGMGIAPLTSLIFSRMLLLLLPAL